MTDTTSGAVQHSAATPGTTAIVATRAPGGAEVLILARRPMAERSAGEIPVRVAASGVPVRDALATRL